MPLERTASHTPTLTSVTSATSTVVSRHSHPSKNAAATKAAISKSNGVGGRLKSWVGRYSQQSVAALVAQGYDERDVRRELKAANGSEKAARTSLKHARYHVPSKTIHADCAVCHSGASGFGLMKMTRQGGLPLPPPTVRVTPAN